MQVSWKSVKSNVYFTWRLFTFMTISHWILLRMRKTKFVEKIKTHILCSVTFFGKSCRFWDNVDKYGGAWRAINDVTIWHIRVGHWISKGTRTRMHTPMRKTGNVRITWHWSAFANYSCRGKSISITYLCVCACSVAYPACNAARTHASSQAISPHSAI